MDTGFNSKSFGNHVALFRHAKGISIRQAATELDLPYTSYWNIENGNFHDVEVLAKVAQWSEMTGNDLAIFFGVSHTTPAEMPAGAKPIDVLVQFGWTTVILASCAILALTMLLYCK